MDFDAVIVSAVRTPVGRAPRGALSGVRADELAALVLTEALRRAPGIAPEAVDDVILGCAMPEGEQGLNLARTAVLRAGLPDGVPALTLNRFCASGLEAIAVAVDRVKSGQCEVVLAGGVESMTRVPMTGFHLAPNPALVRERPDSYLSMGLTAELLAREYGIERAAQDAYALESHRKALAAIAAGEFKDELVPVDLPGGRLEVDEGPRADTSIEALAALPPAFQQGGTVTAGNSSQRSDGAAAVVVIERRAAERLGLAPLARLIAYATAGVDPARMGIGPAQALPKALDWSGLKLEDLDRIELNEAFAVQVLAVFRELALAPARVNPCGGAIALGHPLGCTGAKLTATLLHGLQREELRYGAVTMCVGGGQGAAGIFERI
jgi:acetyl-CoA acyltransferase